VVSSRAAGALRGRIRGRECAAVPRKRPAALRKREVNRSGYERPSGYGLGQVKCRSGTYLMFSGAT